MANFFKKGSKKSKLFFIFLLLFLLGASFVFAQERELEVKYPPVPGAEIPTIKTALPEYVKYIFNFSIMIAGLLALGSLIYGGIRYLTSAGDPIKLKAAKDQILAAFLGLIILLSSYFILTTISPQLVILRIGPIEEAVLPEIEEIPLPEVKNILVASEIPLAQLIDSPKIPQEGVIAKSRMERLRKVEKDPQTGELKETGLIPETKKAIDEVRILGETLRKLLHKCNCVICIPVCTGCCGCICIGDPCRPVRPQIIRTQMLLRMAAWKLDFLKIKIEFEITQTKEDIQKYLSEIEHLEKEVLAIEKIIPEMIRKTKEELKNTEEALIITQRIANQMRQEKSLKPHLSEAELIREFKRRLLAAAQGTPKEEILIAILKSSEVLGPGEVHTLENTIRKVEKYLEEIINHLREHLTILEEILKEIKTEGLKEKLEKFKKELKEKLEKEKPLGLIQALKELKRAEKMMKDCPGLILWEAKVLESSGNFWNFKEALKEGGFVKEFKVVRPWPDVSIEDAQDDPATFYCSEIQIKPEALKSMKEEIEKLMKEEKIEKPEELRCRIEIQVGNIIAETKEIAQGLIDNLIILAGLAQSQANSARIMAPLPDDCQCDNCSCDCPGCCEADCGGCGVPSPCGPQDGWWIPCSSWREVVAILNQIRALQEASKKPITKIIELIEKVLGKKGEEEEKCLEEKWEKKILLCKLKEVREKLKYCVNIKEEWTRLFRGEKMIEKILYSCQDAMAGELVEECGHPDNFVCCETKI